MLIETKSNIILASSSPIRKKILDDVGISYECFKPLCDEEELKKEFRKNNNSIKDLALFLAKNKALSLSDKYPNSYIIGSDQVCEFEGRGVSKSKNKDEAISQLKKFNNKEHFQNNALIVVKDGEVVFSNFEKVRLKLRKLSNLDIENYVNYDESWGCAGSYKYESFGKHLFEEVKGDYYSILGMAIQPLIGFFHRHKIIKFK